MMDKNHIIALMAAVLFREDKDFTLLDTVKLAYEIYATVIELSPEAAAMIKRMKSTKAKDPTFPS